MEEVTSGKAEAITSAEGAENGKQHQKRERDAGLGKNYGIDGAGGVHAREAAGEGSPAKRGRNAPEEGGSGNVEIAADGFAKSRVQV